jgi:hypothetical protein
LEPPVSCKFVRSYLSAELVSTEVVTATVHDEQAAAGGEHLWTIDREITFFPVLLRARRDQHDVISGLALLRVKEDALLLPPSRDLLDALGLSLLLDGRIRGMRADS